MFDNNYRLDGVSMISGYVNGSTFVPSLEALQEVSVQTGQYSASMGLYSGAQVDMVVKSGTNQLHGSAYDFLRNNNLNARQFFDVSAPPPYQFNQFGATIGGPIVLPKIYNGRNRTFFFFAFEGDRTRRQSTGQGTAASAAMRGGNFSELLPAKVIRDPYTKQPFPGNIIPPDRLAPQAQKLLAYVPLPNLPGRVLNFINTGSNKNDENQYFGRLDHHFSPKDTIFFRTALRDTTFRNVTINPNFGSLGYPTNQNHALTETHIFSPRLVNEARVSYVPRIDTYTDWARRSGYRSGARFRNHGAELLRPSDSWNPHRWNQRIHGYRRELRESAPTLFEPCCPGQHHAAAQQALNSRRL